MTVKVCGMRDPDNIRELEATGMVDWMGFIFYEKSPRFVGPEPPEYLPDCPKVGVFVNPTIEYVRTMVPRFGIRLVQLHGNESPEFCKELLESMPDIYVIKAFSVKTEDDLEKTLAYESVVDGFLFDTPCAGYGGSGKTFDWTLMRRYHGHIPFLLSGGIGPDSLEALINFSHPLWYGIDLNSRFETAPGVKDVEALESFISELRKRAGLVTYKCKEHK